MALDDPVLGRAGQRVVLQQHQVHVEQRRQLGRRVVRQVALQRRELGGDRVAGDAQALDLGLDLGFADVVVGDVDAARRDEHRAADRDAARHRQTEHLNAHEPTSANRTPDAGWRPGGFERSM